MLAAESNLPSQVIRPIEYEQAMANALTLRQCEKVHGAVRDTRETYYTLRALLEEHGDITEEDVYWMLGFDHMDPAATTVLNSAIAVSPALGQRIYVNWDSTGNACYYTIEE